MKILFFIESLRPGGKERRLVELIKGLQKYPDMEMQLVLTQTDVHYTDIYSTGVKIHYILRKGVKKDPRLFYKFYKIAKQFKPDIIHVWGNMVAIYAISAKVLLGVPMMNNQIANSPINTKRGMFNYLAFMFSDKIIANSYSGLHAYHVPNHKSAVIYNGFDFDRLNNMVSREEIRKKFNIQTKHVIGMIASFSQSKDYDTYIKSALRILKLRNDVTFLCVGDGDSNKYKAMVPSKFKTRILFLGKQKNVESIMNICDIGILSTYSEGISNSILEFMALGKPIIVTGDGGTKEIVKNDINGFHIEAKKPQLMAEKIELLLTQPDLQLNMGNRGKTIIEKSFNIEKMVTLFINEYKTLLVR